MAAFLGLGLFGALNGIWDISRTRCTVADGVFWVLWMAITVHRLASHRSEWLNGGESTALFTLFQWGSLSFCALAAWVPGLAGQSTLIWFVWIVELTVMLFYAAFFCFAKKWWAHSDLNRGPNDYESFT